MIQQIFQDEKEGKIAPCAPFLSIVNPGYFQHAASALELSGQDFITLDSVVMTPKRLLNKDAEFSAIVSANFELEEEADMIMMLCLIRENAKPSSPWRPFFDRVGVSQR